MSSPDVVRAFWFSPQARPRWFVRSDEFDRSVRDELGELHAAAARGALDRWGGSPHGSLSLILLLDQVPRNMHRDTPGAFATDAQALRVARAAVESGHDRDLTQEERLFVYLPFEHSEDLADQERAVALIQALDEEPTWHTYAIRHRDIIARFGRFPHRNGILGRTSTPDELEFLTRPGSSF